MSAYLHNRLTYVWLFLVATTLVSLALGHNNGTAFKINAAITIGVLLFASIKAQLVIQYFMEVRTSASWLKRVIYGWNLGLFVLLLGIYWFA